MPADGGFGGVSAFAPQTVKLRCTSFQGRRYTNIRGVRSASGEARRSGADPGRTMAAEDQERLESVREHLRKILQRAKLLNPEPKQSHETGQGRGIKRNNGNGGPGGVGDL